MIVEGALEPRGLVPVAPGGTGHQEIPTAAHPQSPQPRDTGQLTSAGPSPHRRHHLDMHAIEHMEKWAHRVLWLFSLGFGVVFPKSLLPRGANLGSGPVGCKLPLSKGNILGRNGTKNMENKLWASRLTHSLGSMGTKVGGNLSRVWLISLRLISSCLTEKLEFFVSFFNMNVWMWLR